MTSWAATSPRTYLNDANRNRFSNQPPHTENLKNSVGPAAYNPKPQVILKSPRGHVALVKTQDGVPERAKEVYGVPVSKILPIHALSYKPKGNKASPFDSITEGGEHKQSTFASRTQRQLWPKNDITAHPEEYPPGPMTYDLPDVHIVSTRNRSPTAWMDSRCPRDCNSPALKEALPMLTSSKMSVYSTSISPTQLNDSPSMMNSFKSAGGSQKTPNKGPTIGHSPRHLNIVNINSSVRRERDADFDNPAPGQYDPVTPRRGVVYSATPKRH